MGTRSLTYVYNEKAVDAGAPLVCMYRQYDGYVSGHGAELAEFLMSGTLVNGLGATDSKVFNGMGCMAAQMIGHFKAGEAGGIYLQAPVVGLDAWQEYEYHVFSDEVVVYEGTIRHGEKIFSGTWEEFKDFCKEKSEA